MDTRSTVHMHIRPMYCDTVSHCTTPFFPGHWLCQSLYCTYFIEVGCCITVISQPHQHFTSTSSATCCWGLLFSSNSVSVSSLLQLFFLHYIFYIYIRSSYISLHVGTMSLNTLGFEQYLSMKLVVIKTIRASDEATPSREFSSPLKVSRPIP